MSYSRTRLALYAFSHFALDMCCFAALYAGAVKSDHAALLVLLYNALAFGLQAPLGALTDRLDDVRPAAVLGLGLVAVGAMAMENYFVCVLLLGIGNALFHVSGAVAVLRERPGDALRAGVYVAPGALGVALGILGASTGTDARAMCVLLMLVCVFLILAVGPGAPRGCSIVETPHEPPVLGAGAIMLCLATIGVRSFGGFSAELANLLLLGAFSAFLGKLLGGVIARKLNWGVLALLGVGIGGLIMAFFPGRGFVYFGVFLFNLAMPLTLSTVMKSLPGRTGLGFGLTTLALLLGWLPLVALETGYHAPVLLLAGIALVAALTLFFILRPRKPITETQEENPDESAA